MKRETLYKVTVIVLLILNLAHISFLVLNKKPQKNFHKNHKQGAREVLLLDHIQDTQFKEFSKKHNESMILLRDEQKQLVKNYFLKPTDSLLNRIKNIEAEKIKITEKHFENMRSVLKEDQLSYYKDFKHEILKSILR
tara:strand:- start:4558 stop:4971 length:414 start_codon:yes stop_codon:yes gene_type:complete